MITKRRALCSALSLVMACAIGTAAAQGAAGYPSKPINLFVAFAPGGAGDIVARAVAKKLSESMGQQVIVQNRPTPNLAPAQVAKAEPDGHTMVMVGNGTALTASLFKSLPFDLAKDFRHVSTLATFDLALLVDGQSQFRTVADLLAFAKANPGKLNIGTVRIGSTQNLVAEMFKSMTGIEAVIVPFKSTGDIISALRSKDVHLAVEIVPPILTQITGGTVKALALTSTKRFPGLPDVPTLAESGLPGFDATSWNGLAVPARTPDAIVHRLEKEVAAAIQSPEVQRELQSIGMVAEASTSEQMTQRIRSDMAKWRSVIQKANIPLQ